MIEAKWHVYKATVKRIHQHWLQNLTTLKNHLKKGFPLAGIDTLIDVLLTKMVTAAHATKHIYMDPEESDDPYLYFIKKVFDIPSIYTSNLECIYGE